MNRSLAAKSLLLIIFGAFILVWNLDMIFMERNQMLSVVGTVDEVKETGYVDRDRDREYCGGVHAYIQ